MDQYYSQFIINLKKFLETLSTLSPNENVTNFLNMFDDLDMTRVIPRFLKVVRKVETGLSVRDNTIFNQSLNILPGIDMKICWTNIPENEQHNIWTMLQKLYIAGEQMTKESKGHQSDKKSKLIQDMINNMDEYTDVSYQTMNFNPYSGVNNEKETHSLSLDEICDQSIKIPDLEKSENGMSGIPGLGSLVNLDQLKEQLSNMNQEDLDKATDTIKELLGSNIDEKTSNTISDMLSNITNELKNTNLDDGDPIKNIFKIANSVAHKMKGKIDTDGLDVQNLMNSTKTLAGKCMGDQNQQLFGDNSALLNMLMGQMNPQSMQQCQQMMQQMPQEDMISEMAKNLSQVQGGNLSSSSEFNNLDSSVFMPANKKNKQKNRRK